jgi:hypothetical protein
MTKNELEILTNLYVFSLKRILECRLSSVCSYVCLYVCLATA